MRVMEALREGKRILEKEGIEEPFLNAVILLSSAAGWERWEAWVKEEIPEDIAGRYFEYIEKRKKRVPVEYITGKVKFCELELLVYSGVFIPRPETEEVAEVALREIEGIKNPVVYDIGTGTGCIALWIKKKRPDATVFSTDIDKRAVENAKENAKRLGIEISVLEGDLFSPLHDKPAPDLIVSNPPYIPEGKELPPEVRYEPENALFGGKKGRKIIERIIHEGKDILKREGKMVIEIDPANLPLNIPPCFSYEIKKDPAGKERILILRRKE
ncbi:peptide chain release factor N(5)-glutamine methyltransferase [bacterium]|nr:MAG: peptide chain release factor N(5)-glutamine methyltransferase [bacterium]